MPVNNESMLLPGMDASADINTQLCFTPPNGPFDGESTESMVTGMLDSKHDEDWIAIHLSEGKEYTISVTGSNTLTDTVIALYDSKGNHIMTVDDVDANKDGVISGTELHPSIMEFRPEEGTDTSTYFISVSAYNDNPGIVDGTNQGKYTVTVDEKVVLAVGEGREIGADGAGPNKLIGTDLADKLTGGDGADTLDGRGGNDELKGGKGNDLLIGGKGADKLSGGDGNDTASYSGSSEAVTINLLSGTAAGGDATGDEIMDDIENIIGSMHGDMLTGNDEDNWLWGLAGDDTLDGGYGDDTVEGGYGADTLIGGDGNDTASYATSMMGVVVRLHPGRDGQAIMPMQGDAEGDMFGKMVTATYFNADGDPVEEMVPDIENLTGSAHDDVLAGDSRDNTIMGGDGHDRLFGGPGGGNDMLHGEGGNDSIFGGKGNDTLDGGDGDDELWGNSGTDIYRGGAGDDMIHASKDDTNINGGPGDDTVSFAKLEDTPYAINLTSMIMVENIIGSQDDDMITGGAGHNVIEGHEGGDTMTGGGEMDTLSYAHSDDGVRVRLLDSAVNDNWIDASRGHASGDEVTAATQEAQTFFNIMGSDYDDRLTGDNRGNSLMGGDGEDDLTGMDGADTIEGGAGGDMLDGGDGKDASNTDDTGDWLSYESSDAAVTINLHVRNGQVLANGGDATGDEIVTTEEDHDGNSETDDVDVSTFEHVRGSAHDDNLTGDHRSNTLEGGAGADALDGGAGWDTATFENAMAGVTIDLGANKGMGGEADGDTYSNIEMFMGSEMGDTFVAGRGHDSVHGGGGSDTISYEKSKSGVTVNLAGQISPANDTAADVVGAWRYLADNLDKFYVDGSNVDAGAGRTDTANTRDAHEDGFDSLEALLTGLDPDNTTDDIDPANIRVDDGGKMDNQDPPQPVDDVTVNSILTGGRASTNDNYGTTIPDVTSLYGSDNDRSDLRNNYNKGDQLDGIENVIGSDFDDMITGNSPQATNNPDTTDVDEAMTRRTGNKLEGGAGKDTITGGAGNDVIDGGDGDDPMLDGGDGHDDIMGGAGRDILDGGNGNDILNGGAGDDTLTGGDGDDTFVFAPGHGDDLIKGLDTGDKIDLRAFGIKTLEELVDNIDEFGGNVRLDLSDYEGGGTIILQGEPATLLGLIGTPTGNTGVTAITADDPSTTDTVEGVFLIA